MNVYENIKNEYIKQMKLSKTLCLISSILIPVGILAALFLYAFYPSVAAILISGSVAIVGFMLDGKGETLQTDSREWLKKYYHNKIASSPNKNRLHQVR